MKKKLYFLNVADFKESETLGEISDAEFKKRAEIVYDSVEEYLADFNSELSPSYSCYYVRYI